MATLAYTCGGDAGVEVAPVVPDSHLLQMHLSTVMAPRLGCRMVALHGCPWLARPVAQQLCTMLMSGTISGPLTRRAETQPRLHRSTAADLTPTPPVAKVIFLPINSVADMAVKSKFAHFFDIMYFSNSLVHNLTPEAGRMCRKLVQLFARSHTPWVTLPACLPACLCVLHPRVASLAHRCTWSSCRVACRARRTVGGGVGEVHARAEEGAVQAVHGQGAPLSRCRKTIWRVSSLSLHAARCLNSHNVPT